MIPIRWRKVLRDLGSNKTRTLLVLLSIAVGVTAIGMVLGSQIIVDESLPEAYAAVNPASGTLFAISTFDDDMVEAIRAMPEVGEAEGRRFVNVRFLTGDGEWRSMQLFAIPDFDDMSINKINSEEGAFPPPERTLVIERDSFRASLGLGDVQIGDTLIIEPPDGKQREIAVSGSVHDLSQLPAFINGSGYGYITYDTLEWLGEPRDFNQVVYVVEENRLDIEHIQDVGKMIEDKLARSGVIVLFTLIFPPGEHPAQNFLNAFSLILGAMGIVSLALSGFLIINTLSAIMTQHVRQIGIMKAIGAKTPQVSGMYLVMVLLFGLLSLVISIPLGALGAAGLANLFAGFLNFDVAGFQLNPRVASIQIAITLAAPLLSAIVPIIRGVRVTVREALSEQGLGKGQFGSSFVDRIIVGLRAIIPMERPAQISLRNTFRRKSRLTLTLITLSLASAIFVSIFSVRASLLQTLDDALNYFDYDIQVVFDVPYRAERLQAMVRQVPGVDRVETWGFSSVRRIRPDGTESDSIIVYAPEPDSEMVNPILIEGRWLVEGDTNAVVVNTDVLRNEDDVGIGDVITLDINGRESDWEVVGIVRGILTGPNIFTNFEYFTRVTKDVDKAQISQVRLADRSAANQSELGSIIEDTYRRSGFRVQQMATIAQLRTIISSVFNIIIIFLLFMAVLLGVVGGLGLMGTMSINVLERTREIGVMRAIGASDRAVLRIVLLEGVIIGLISWIIGGIIALPVSKILADAVGTALLQSPPSYVFSTGGAILWLFTVLVLAAFASFLPARGASRLTVREVLSYE
ncbi:MAG: ABC transporter permease [Anaerolineales bacterium]|nr:ABC transporter permease [Anaerolineales bacterium]